MVAIHCVLSWLIVCPALQPDGEASSFGTPDPGLN